MKRYFAVVLLIVLLLGCFSSCQEAAIQTTKDPALTPGLSCEESAPKQSQEAPEPTLPQTREEEMSLEEMVALLFDKTSREEVWEEWERQAINFSGYAVAIVPPQTLVNGVLTIPADHADKLYVAAYYTSRECDSHEEASHKCGIQTYFAKIAKFLKDQEWTDIVFESDRIQYENGGFYLFSPGISPKKELWYYTDWGKTESLRLDGVDRVKALALSGATTLKNLYLNDHTVMEDDLLLAYPSLRCVYDPISALLQMEVPYRNWENYLWSKDTTPCLTLSSDGSFVLVENLGDAMGTYKGSYTVYRDELTLTVKECDFGGFTGAYATKLRFTVRDDGTLVLETGLVQSVYGHVFDAEVKSNDGPVPPLKKDVAYRYITPGSRKYCEPTVLFSSDGSFVMIENCLEGMATCEGFYSVDRDQVFVSVTKCTWSENLKEIVFTMDRGGNLILENNFYSSLSGAAFTYSEQGIEFPPLVMDKAYVNLRVEEESEQEAPTLTFHSDGSFVLEEHSEEGSEIHRGTYRRIGAALLLDVEYEGCDCSIPGDFVSKILLIPSDDDDSLRLYTNLCVSKYWDRFVLS